MWRSCGISRNRWARLGVTAWGGAGSGRAIGGGWRALLSAVADADGRGLARFFGRLAGAPGRAFGRLSGAPGRAYGRAMTAFGAG